MSPSDKALVDGNGRVLVEISMRLPAQVAQTIWGIVEAYQR